MIFFDLHNSFEDYGINFMWWRNGGSEKLNNFLNLTYPETTEP